jgi:short-subunit dehydrogenase
LTNRIAIFGATSAIATEVARLYARQAAQLVIIGRDHTRLAALAADLKVRGADEVRIIERDLAEIDGLSEVSAQAWDAFRGLDLALVAHGVLPDQAVAQNDTHALATAVQVNFVSPAALCAALAPRFETARQGTLAVITSVAGDRGRQSNYVYGAAKGGLQRYLEGLRHRLYGKAVKVLDVRPGLVSTPMTAHLGATGPLWASPKAVAADIVKAATGGKGVRYTPWYWAPIMLAVRSLPASVFHRLRL